jgi:hypothetical protein
VAAVSDFILRGAFADRPAASATKVGRLYHATDTGIIYRDNGSTWDVFAADSSVAVLDSLLDAKGDLIVASAADTAARLAVGSDDKELVADASESVGQKWVENHAWIKTGSGVIYPAFGNGDLSFVAFQNAMGGSAGTSVTAAQVSTVVARMVKFRLPRTLAVTDFYIFPVATTTNCWTVAIYPVGSATSKTWSHDIDSTTANTWYTVGSLSFTLTANTDYWFCVAARDASAGASFRTGTTLVHANLFGSEDGPLGGLSCGVPEYAEIAVTAGAWPATLPTVVEAGNGGTWTGATPYAYVKGTGS